MAVAHELKRLRPGLRLIYILEKGSKFADLPAKSPDIDAVYEVHAGKFRRYHGQRWFQRALDVPTIYKNSRDGLRVLAGLRDARRILKKEKPDAIFIKGGFVGVPVGLAASRLDIPFITHDSDSVPGLANRIIAKWATLHATGMPAEFYDYPKDKTVFVGIPLRPEFQPLTPALRQKYHDDLGLESGARVVTIIGGSQGAQGLNKAMLAVAAPLMTEDPNLVFLHITGEANEEAMKRAYRDVLSPAQRHRAVVKGYINDIYRYSGAADVIVTRAGATNTAEFAAQRQACIVVPGALAGGHQNKNAEHMAASGAVETLTEKEAQNPATLGGLIHDLLNDSGRRATLGRNLARLGKPDAALALAQLLLDNFDTAATGEGRG